MTVTLFSIPFTDLGPTGKYWLGAFDEDSPLHRFLTVAPFGSIPFPRERAAYWTGRARDRGDLVLGIRNQSLPLSSVQSEALDRLARPETLCVVTGQQPGLAGGPLYTFNKILSTIVFARRLEQRWNRPVVPILWDGGEDHDYEEIHHLCWLPHEGEPVRFELEKDFEGTPPAFSIPFPESSFEKLIRFVRSVHPPTGYREALESFLYDVRQDAETWTDFFDRFWLRLFKDYPLLVVRPWEPSFRESAVPVIRREIGQPQAYLREIEETSDALSRAGFKPQIHKKDGTCSFFYWDGGSRRKVLFDGKGFSLPRGERKWSESELLRELDRNPAAFSPSAVLRPIVQDHLLPVAAAVLGPSEIAYHCQIGSLYRRHEIPRPVILPRFSCSFVFPRQVSLLKELGLDWKDLSRHDSELMKQVVRSDFLEESLGSLSGLNENVRKTTENLVRLCRDHSKGLVDPLRKQFGKVEKILGQVESLLKREEARRHDNLQRRIVSLQRMVVPGGQLQERIYCLLPFLARQGFDWIDSLVDCAAQWDGEKHYVFQVGGRTE